MDFSERGKVTINEANITITTDSDLNLWERFGKNLEKKF